MRHTAAKTRAKKGWGFLHGGAQVWVKGSNRLTSVGILGYGHVGRSMARLFPAAAIYDPHLAEFAGNSGAVSSASVTFVCVPTPARDDGSADIDNVADAVGWLESDIIVIKSTVPPGTTTELRKLTGKRIVVAPEYFGESTYSHPWSAQPEMWPFVVVGGAPGDTRVIVELLAERLGPHIVYRQVSPEQAELAKYMENAWLAAQVGFAWQFELLARAIGVDYWEVREIWALDPRVSRWHTATFSAHPGYGGKCLPKDIAAITRAGRDRGCDVSLLEALQNFNQNLRE